MTPREAADRLFNRVMRASQQKNDQEVRQFSPMAIAAYARVDSLDNDARYHLALIHLAGGDVDGARREVALIRKSVPRHLLAFMIDHELASRDGKRQEAEVVRQRFLNALESELKQHRPEYDDHRNMIDRFRDGDAR